MILFFNKPDGGSGAFLTRSLPKYGDGWMAEGQMQPQPCECPRLDGKYAAEGTVFIFTLLYASSICVLFTSPKWSRACVVTPG